LLPLWHWALPSALRIRRFRAVDLVMAQYHFIGGDGKTYGPYSQEQMQPFMAENRVNAQTQVSADGGAWQPAGQYPELASTGGAPPVPANLGAPAAPGMPLPMVANPAAAQAMLKGPAIFMMVLAIFSLILVPLSILYQFTQGQDAYSDLPPELRDFLLQFSGVASVVSNGLSFIANILILIGALKMRKCQSYGLAMTASILCILCDWSCCCLGIGAGIWAIVVLCKPEVKAAFH
jgi:hypothetical protein